MQCDRAKAALLNGDRAGVMAELGGDQLSKPVLQPIRQYPDHLANESGDATAADAAVVVDPVRRLLNPHLLAGNAERFGGELPKDREHAGAVLDDRRVQHDLTTAADRHQGGVFAEAVAHLDEGDPASDARALWLIPVDGISRSLQRFARLGHGPRLTALGLARSPGRVDDSQLDRIDSHRSRAEVHVALNRVHWLRLTWRPHMSTRNRVRVDHVRLDAPGRYLVGADRAASHTG